MTKLVRSFGLSDWIVLLALSCLILALHNTPAHGLFMEALAPISKDRSYLFAFNLVTRIQRHFSLSHSSHKHALKDVQLGTPIAQSVSIRTNTGSFQVDTRRLQSEAESLNIEGLYKPRRLLGVHGNVLGFLAPDGSISESQLIVMDVTDEEGKTNQPEASWKEKLVAPRSCSETDLFKKFTPCPASMRDAIPRRRHDVGNGIDACSEGLQSSCLIEVPKDYKRQYRWPQTRAKARLQNVPGVPLLTSKGAAEWITISNLTIHFLPGGPAYPTGASAYLDHLAKLVPDIAWGEKTRVVLDVGGGSGSLSAALEDRGVLALCVASHQSPENAIQLLLERGYPGLLLPADLPPQRLPFPSEAFDMIHCAASDSFGHDAAGKVASMLHADKLPMVEADRLLRRGGYLVWIANASAKADLWGEMELEAGRLCWKLSGRAGSVALWHKPEHVNTEECYHDPLRVPLCPSEGPPADATWKVPIQACIVESSPSIVARQTNWTARLIDPPPRLQGVSAAGLQSSKHLAYKADLNYWIFITDFYVRFLHRSRVRSIRNVLDMNAGYGGFAVAVAMREPGLLWWTLSVVPVDADDRLALIFDRGLLGLYHDWCSMRKILHEIDRLLRPGGFVLIRDQKNVLSKVQKIAKALHWKTSIHSTDSGPMGMDKLLHCEKQSRRFHRPS